MNISVAIATPCYAGQVAARFTESLLATIEALRLNGIEARWRCTTADALIGRARDALVGACLSWPQCSHIFWCDADLDFSPDSVLRLIEHDLDVVCALYRMKKETVDFGLDPVLDADGNGRFDTRTGLIEVKTAPGGFMLVKRQVYEKIAAARPELKLSQTAPLPEGWEPHLYHYHPCGIQDGSWLPEDHGFQGLWRSIGGKIFADLSIQMAHLGQFPFMGSPMELLRAPNAAAA